MNSTLILGAIVMLLLGIVFGTIASGKGPQMPAATPKPKRKAAAKRAPAKRKTARKRKK